MVDKVDKAEKIKQSAADTSKDGSQSEAGKSADPMISGVESEIDLMSLPSQTDPKELHEQIENLNEELEKARSDQASSHDQLLRKEAELQNVIKRTKQEVENAKKFALERFAQELLVVIDSMEQGLSFTDSDKITVEALTEGTQLTLQMFLDLLKNQGISQIDPKGQAFDPKQHEAISMQETNDVEPNQVVAVVQKGYMLQSRLLRPARVVVSKASEDKSKG